MELESFDEIFIELELIYRYFFIVVAHQVYLVGIRLLQVYALCDHHLLVLLSKVFCSIDLLHCLFLFDGGPESI